MTRYRPKNKDIVHPSLYSEIVMPGQPLIYSAKYKLGQRHFSESHFRNAKWASMLKCLLPAYVSPTIPVVLLLRFYTEPPNFIKVSAAKVASETTPAVENAELCEYILSFLEMLPHVLIDTYRQVVKIDAEKYYSNNPRTVVRFMTWENYVTLRDNNTLYTKGKSIGPDEQARQLLQSEL